MGKHGVHIQRRIWRYVDPHGPNGCWQWTGRLSASGYGLMSHNGRGGKSVGAHRLMYEILVERIPEGLVIDHLCRNIRCVNPDHLEAVTTAENIRRGYLYKVWPPECPKGHPFDEANTGWMKTKRARRTRRCLQCHRDSERRRAQRKRDIAISLGDKVEA